MRHKQVGVRHRGEDRCLEKSERWMDKDLKKLIHREKNSHFLSYAFSFSLSPSFILSFCFLSYTFSLCPSLALSLFLSLSGSVVWYDSSQPVHPRLHQTHLHPLLEGQVSVRPLRPLVHSMRAIKSAAEVELMKRAGEITAQVCPASPIYSFACSLPSRRLPSL